MYFQPCVNKTAHLWDEIIVSGGTPVSDICHFNLCLPGLILGTCPLLFHLNLGPLSLKKIFQMFSSSKILGV